MIPTHQDLDHKKLNGCTKFYMSPSNASDHISMAWSCLSDSVRRLMNAADARHEHASLAVNETLKHDVKSDSIEFSEELIKDVLKIDSAAAEDRNDEWFYDSILRIGPLIQRCLQVVLSWGNWDSSDHRQGISLPIYLPNK